MFKALNKIQPRFSLRTLLVIVFLVGAYLASWDATKTYGVVAGTSQRSPMPFILTEDGIPHFKRGPTLILEQERTYFYWFFGEPRQFYVRELHQEWPGLSGREQIQVIKQIAGSRRKRIDRSLTAK